MEANMESIKSAQEKFAELIQSEFERIERMKADKEVTDFSKLYLIFILFLYCVFTSSHIY